MNQTTHSIQITKTSNEKGGLTTDSEEGQRIINSHFKNMYFTILENINKMEDLLDTFHLPKINEHQVNYLISPRIHKEIETAFKIFQLTKSQGQMVLVPSSNKLSKKN